MHDSEWIKITSRVIIVANSRVFIELFMNRRSFVGLTGESKAPTIVYR